MLWMDSSHYRSQLEPRGREFHSSQRPWLISKTALTSSCFQKTTLSVGWAQAWVPHNQRPAKKHLTALMLMESLFRRICLSMRFCKGIISKLFRESWLRGKRGGLIWLTYTTSSLVRLWRMKEVTNSLRLPLSQGQKSSWPETSWLLRTWPDLFHHYRFTSNGAHAVLNRISRDSRAWTRLSSRAYRQIRTAKLDQKVW